MWNRPGLICLTFAFFTGLAAGHGLAEEKPGLKPLHGVSGTFSIVAVDPETGEVGAAVASRYPAVGKVVPYVRAGVGAFCTQHWHNPQWGERALDLLQAGHGSEAVLGILLKDDERKDKRQLAIIDASGRAANRNPSRADPSGVYWGAMSGRFYACQGNTLAGRKVIVAMARAYEETRGSLTDRLMAALVAGDCAGGDHRGRLAAGVRVARKGTDGIWFELYVDKSDDAVRDLFRKYVEVDHPAKGAWKPDVRKPCSVPAVSGRYPGIPASVWTDLAATMNAEYESWAASQSTQVARIESLPKHLRRPHCLLAKGLGDFPTIDLEAHDQLILGSGARQGRETGVVETIDPFAKKDGAAD